MGYQKVLEIFNMIKDFNYLYLQSLKTTKKKFYKFLPVLDNPIQNSPIQNSSKNYEMKEKKKQPNTKQSGLRSPACYYLGQFFGLFCIGLFFVHFHSFLDSYVWDCFVLDCFVLTRIRHTITFNFF